MRRREFIAGLLLASAPAARAQEPGKQHRIAVIFSGPVGEIREAGSRYWPAFFTELRRLGDVEGQNLTVERYSGEGRPEDLAKLAREVVNRNPDLIVATTNLIALAVRAASGTIPIVWMGANRSVPGSCPGERVCAPAASSRKRGPSSVRRRLCTWVQAGVPPSSRRTFG